MERRAFTALGGDCELFAIDTAPAKLAEGEAWVRRMHDRFTRFSESSELSHFNAVRSPSQPRDSLGQLDVPRRL